MNAKELILEKINATPDLMGIYVYLLFKGNSFAESASFMTSPIMNLIKEKAKGNIFDSNTVNIIGNRVDAAIDYFLNGPGLAGYVSDKYVNSFMNLWYDYYQKTKIPESEGLSINLTEAVLSENFFKNYKEGFLEYIKNSTSIEANSNLNPNLNKKNMDEDDYYYDYEYDPSEENEDIIRSSKDNIKILFNRYISDAERRINLLKGINKEDLLEIKELRKGAAELQLLGKLSSLNQGIKTQAFEQINFLQSIEKSINKTLDWSYEEKNLFSQLNSQEFKDKINSLTEDDLEDKSKLGKLKKETVELYLKMKKYKFFDMIMNDEFSRYTKFDLNEYVNNPEWNTYFKSLYQYKAKFVNILDVMDTVPHFKNMLKTFTVNNQDLNILTARWETIKHIVQKLKDFKVLTKQLNKSTYNRINKFVTDCIVEDYLNKITFSLPNIKTIFINGTSYNSDEDTDITLDLSNYDDRLTFKNWMEEILLSYSKNNFDDFSNNITFKTVLNDVRLPYVLAALDIDMSTMSKDINTSRRSSIALAYGNLYANKKIGDNRFGDLLFIYNLMMNKNIGGEYSFTSLFKNDLSDPDNEVSKYFEYLSKLSKQGSQSIKYSINDLLLRVLPYDMEVNKIVKKRNLSGETEFKYDGSKILENNLISNINTLPFISGSVKYIPRAEVIQMVNTLTKLIAQGKAEFKLNCD